MIFDRIEGRRRGLFWIGAVALITAARFAGAATITYDANVGGEKRGVTVSALDVNGTQFYPLRSIVSQLGGGCQITEGRVQVDLAGQTAWIGLNDTAVNGSVSQSTLQRPIVRQDNEVLISAGDVVPFFRKTFRVELTATESDLLAPLEPSKPAAPAVPLQSIEERPGAPGGAPAIGVVIIDPGHGGANSGAENERNFKEKDLTLAIARQLKKTLELSKAVRVFLTRDADADVSLRDRIGFAGKNKGDLYISIHAGASLSGAVKGLALFVPPAGEVPAAESRAGAAAPLVRQDYSARSMEIANGLAAGLSAATSAPLLGVRPLRTRVLRNLTMPGVLVEVGCLTNAEEGAQLQTEAYQARIAAGLAGAILKFAAAPAAGGSS